MHRNASTEYGNLKRRVVERGYTLHSWALKRGHRPTTVYAAARGERSGVKSIKIRRQLEELCQTK